MELAILLLLIFLTAIPFVFLRDRFPAPELIMARHQIWWSRLGGYSSWPILFFSLIMVLVIFGRSVTAKWNIIDDHEIMYFLGADGKLSAGEIFYTLSLTEVGSFGVHERFRPAYYFLRIIECVLWGASPFAWHVARLAILWLGISLTWHLVFPRLGLMGGGLFCAYILTFPFWADTIGKLGAGEAYAVLGLPVYIWGLIQALKLNRALGTQLLAGMSILVGSVICIGSKENFLLIVIPSLYIAWKSFWGKKYHLFFFALGSIAFALFVGTAVVLLVTGSGEDVYQNSISAIARLKILLDALFTDLHLPTLAIFVILILCLSSLLLVRGTSVEMRHPIQKSFFWLVVLVVVFFSQIVFYNGVWPRAKRYDFPGILYIPATAYVLYVLAQEITARAHRPPISKYSIGTVFSATLFLMVITKGYGGIMQQIREDIDSTNGFTHSMKELSLMLNENPEYALVLESNDMWQYERVASTQRFLSFYGVQNVMFLRIHCYSAELGRTPQETFLAADLERISSQGSSLFLPLSRLEEYQDHCVSMDLSDFEFGSCASIVASFGECRKD